MENNKKVDGRTLVRFKTKNLLKIEKMYNYYVELQKEVKDKMPDIFPYVAKNYYYNKISELFDVGTNHLSTIINKIENNPEQFYNDLEEAKSKVRK